MPTLVLDPPPAELQALLERRHKWGADTRDEVWNGVLHVTPAPEVEHARVSQRLAVLLDSPARAAGLEAVMAEFNLGSPDDYRVPDGGLLHPEDAGTWLATAPLAVEILSPGDETWEKLPFYAAHHVDELLIVDPEKKSVEWLGLKDGKYAPIERSALIDLGAAELAQRIEWP